MTSPFQRELLKSAHGSWHGCLKPALQSMDPAFLNDLQRRPHWLPGKTRCLRALAAPLAQAQVVWLGESPYPRAASATGLCFHDGAVGELFSADGALSKTVNRATSLRNWMKAWFVAMGRLDAADTAAAAIRRMDKRGLIRRLDALFMRGQQQGWIWLNAGLSLDPMQPKTAQITPWNPLVTAVLKAVSDRGGQIVLLGRFSHRFAPEVNAPLITEHPYNVSFIHNAAMRSFLRQWRSLIMQ